MKLHYSFLILSLTSILTQCSDNNNNCTTGKNLDIVNAFLRIATKKEELSRPEIIRRKAIKKELAFLQKQHYIQQYHPQIQQALALDNHKTPENSPVKQIITKKKINTGAKKDISNNKPLQVVSNKPLKGILKKK